MRNSSGGLAGIVASLVFIVTQDAVAQGPGPESGRFPWYVAVGVGSSRAGVLKQAGFNRDDICYPTNVCPRAPAGYRWSYDLDSDSGTAFDLAVGRSVNAFRLEVSTSSTAHDVDQAFTGITYFDGTPVVSAADSDFANVTETAVEGFSAQTLSFSVYRHFPAEAAGLDPYVGIGVGFSRMELSGLYFRSEFTCVRGPCAGRPASEYNSHQDTDLTDTAWSGQVHAGVDYPLAGNRHVLGLKLSYRAAGDMEARAGYLTHPIPDEISTTTIGETDQWSLTLGIKYRFGTL